MMMQTNNNFFIIALFLIIFAALYYLSPILMPFMAGAILAYLCDPIVKKLMRWKVPHLLAVAIVFFVLLFSIILFVLLLIPLIQSQIVTLSQQIPKTIVWLETKIFPWIVAKLHIENFDMNDIKSLVTTNLVKATGMASWILHSGKAIFHAIIYIVLIPVVTFYLLRDWDFILLSIRNALPARIKPTVIQLAKECDSVLSAFFRGQLLVMLCLAVMYSFALTLMGLQLGVIIGIIVGITSIFPYLGLLIGIAIAMIAALVQFGTSSSVLWVLLIFAVGHSIENFYLTPKLIGNRIGLHPVLVIFAILAGGTLFGFFGILLALPVAAVIMVLLRHAHEYFRSTKHYVKQHK